MNARIREKQAAYLAAMGRAPAEDPRGPTIVELRPPGSSDADEVTVTFDNPRRMWRIRAKVTKQIVKDICRELGRTSAQLIATPTKQSQDFDTAWIKANDGPDATVEGGVRLAFVTGLSPTVINIVLGHPIPRVEQVPGTHKNFSRFLPMGSSQAKAAKDAAVIAAGGTPTEAIEPEADPADTSPEPDISGDDE
jgi:hypothetical protein